MIIRIIQVAGDSAEHSVEVKEGERLEDRAWFHPASSSSQHTHSPSVTQPEGRQVDGGRKKGMGESTSGGEGREGEGGSTSVVEDARRGDIGERSWTIRCHVFCCVVDISGRRQHKKQSALTGTAGRMSWLRSYKCHGRISRL